MNIPNDFNDTTDGIPPHESQVGETLPNGEIITRDIETIDDAYAQIIDDTRERVSALDWGHFGISSEEVSVFFDVSYPLVLRNSPYSLPINCLIDRRDKERGLLLETPDSMKKQCTGEYWIALTGGVIPADTATFIRDHLYLKTPEIIAGVYKIDKVELLMHLSGGMDARGPMQQAAIRTLKYINSNPSVFRSGEDLLGAKI